MELASFNIIDLTLLQYAIWRIDMKKFVIVHCSVLNIHFLISVSSLEKYY